MQLHLRSNFYLNQTKIIGFKREREREREREIYLMKLNNCARILEVVIDSINGNVMLNMLVTDVSVCIFKILQNNLDKSLIKFNYDMWSVKRNIVRVASISQYNIWAH